MTEPTNQHPAGVKSDKEMSFLRQYLRALRFYFVTGILVWVPLLVTLWLTWWLFKTVGLGFEDVIKAGYDALNRLGERVPRLEFLTELKYVRGFGFLIAVALFLTTGILTRSIVARRLIEAAERLLDRIPLVSKVYRAVQQIRDVFVTREGTVFQKVCLVQYPRKGMYAVAFVTSREQGIVQDALGRELHAVFLPSTPNPTTGFLLYLPAEDVTVVDISVEDAMKLIISGGAYLPGTRAVEEVEAKEELEPVRPIKVFRR